MPLPLIPLGLAAVAAYFLTKGSDKKDELAPDVAKLVDPHMSRAMAEATLALMSTSNDWNAQASSSLALYGQGYPVASRTLMSAANYWRQKEGLPPFAFPPNAAQIAQAMGASIPVPAPPGLKDIQGVPPLATIPGVPASLAKQPGIIDQPLKANPNPDGSVTVTLPNGMVVTVPAGIMGTVIPGATTAANAIPGLPVPLPGPRPVPGGGMTTQPDLPPGFKQPMPGGVTQPKIYPTGTHTRPDGSYGYTTQSGDFSTDKIASKFGGTGAQLRAANPGVAWTKNYAGTDLNVPGAWITSPPPAGQRGPVPPGATTIAAPQSPKSAPAGTSTAASSSLPGQYSSAPSGMGDEYRVVSPGFRQLKAHNE